MGFGGSQPLRRAARRGVGGRRGGRWASVGRSDRDEQAGLRSGWAGSLRPGCWSAAALQSAQRVLRPTLPDLRPAHVAAGLLLVGGQDQVLLRLVHRSLGVGERLLARRGRLGLVTGPTFGLRLPFGLLRLLPLRRRLPWARPGRAAVGPGR